jgi:hypothetical protein
MRTKWSILAAAVLIGATCGGPLGAQTPARPGGIVPTTTPGYSPYLNLLRRDAPTFQQYYGLVRPEVEFRGAIGTLQRQEVLNQDEINGVAASGLPATGHRTAFLNTGGYFLNRSGPLPAQGAAGAKSTGAVAPRR